MADTKSNKQGATTTTAKGQGATAMTTAAEVKPKRKRPDRDIQVEEGDNRKYLLHSLRLAELPEVSMSDADAVRDRVYDYFRIVAEDDMKPSIEGLALSLNVTRQYLYQIREGARGKNPEVVATLKKAVQILQLQMADYMANGKINPVSGIFLMKNNFNYADKQEVVLKPDQPLGNLADDKALEQKYLEDIVSTGKEVTVDD